MKLKLSLKNILMAGVTGAVIGFLTWGFVAVSEWGTSRSTDDAYVAADITLVAPRVAGFISRVLVNDNQYVRAGQLLAKIDDRDFRTAVISASANVHAARAKLEHASASLAQQQAVIAEARAGVNAGEAEFTFAQYEMKRYSALAKAGAGTVQLEQRARDRIDTARAKLAFDQAALTAAEHQVKLLTASRDQAQSGVAEAEAGLAKAKLDLSYTLITAPVDGVVGERTLRLGAYVNPGSPLLAVVPVRQAYVVANFRETQLAGVRPDEPVRIKVDSLRGRVFTGHVDSIAPATGTEFSPIAASNATGNFTKVVQRIPVKIRIDAVQDLNGELRAGMSVVATIDTSPHAPDELALR